MTNNGINQWVLEAKVVSSIYRKQNKQKLLIAPFGASTIRVLLEDQQCINMVSFGEFGVVNAVQTLKCIICD